MKQDEIVKILLNKFKSVELSEESYRISNLGKFLEIQNCHFICEHPYIFKEICSNEYDEKWYEDNYFPIISKQLPKCIELLCDEPDTRRAILVLADRECYDKNDFICTEYVQLFLNGNHIKYIVNMRSSDIAKFPTDYNWHLGILNKIKNELEDKMGKIYIKDPIEWNAGSLHIYENDIKKIFKNI